MLAETELLTVQRFRAGTPPRARYRSDPEVARYQSRPTQCPLWTPSTGAEFAAAAEGTPSGAC